MVEISIPTASAVSATIFYLGLSVGWHTGVAMTKWDVERREDDTHWWPMTKRAIFKLLHHYDSGIALLMVGLGLLFGWPPTHTAAGLFLAGYGIGMAYDDREDHPPENMTRHILKKMRRPVQP